MEPISARKLLVVDDEADLVRWLEKDLGSHGYRIFTAGDGHRALEIAREESPHLILLDLMLPKLDGYRVLKLLKSDERYRGIPILVITARADEQDLTLALECGADGCLVKPLKFEALLERVRALVGAGEGDGPSSE